MALHTFDPDPETVEAVRAHLSELVGRAEFSARRLARANPLALALAVPHEIYYMGLDELAEGRPVTTARSVAQGFLVFDGAEPVASAEVGGEGSGFMVTEGQFVGATARAIERAERRDDIGDAEVRLMRIPAVYLMALWLHDPDGRDDVVIPMEPAPAPLEAGRTYRPEELIQPLAEMARRRLDGGDELGG